MSDAAPRCPYARARGGAYASKAAPLALPLPPQEGEGRAPFLRGAGDLAAPAAPDAAPLAPAGLRSGLGLAVRVSWVTVS